MMAVRLAEGPPEEGHASHRDRSSRRTKRDLPDRPAVDEADANSGRMQEAGRDHETDTVEEGVRARLQLRPP